MDAAAPRRRPRFPSPEAEAEAAVLESLPPELLNAILSRLPLRDAVRTSALARAWRSCWESVPSLKFEWSEGADAGAITGVLRRWHIQEASFRHSDRWLRLLARKGIQTLVLGFERSEEGLHKTLHPSIFSCRELTVLNLNGCDVPTTPPGFAGLPNLTVLCLYSVGFPEGARDLELLIATSPLLEVLSLNLLRVPYSNDGDDKWVIQAPKLRQFYVTEIDDLGWQINDLPSLEEAEMVCTFDLDFVKLMTGLAWARELRIQLPIGDHNVLEGLSCSFNNLKSLLLRTSLGLMSSVLSVFCLLRNSPKLEDLNIELNDNYSQDDEVDSDFLNAQWTVDLLSSLIHVDVMGMTCK